MRLYTKVNNRFMLISNDTNLHRLYEKKLKSDRVISLYIEELSGFSCSQSDSCKQPIEPTNNVDVDDSDRDGNVEINSDGDRDGDVEEDSDGDGDGEKDSEGNDDGVEDSEGEDEEEKTNTDPKNDRVEGTSGVKEAQKIDGDPKNDASKDFEDSEHNIQSEDNDDGIGKIIKMIKCLMKI
ncbi:hypothetical protein Pfo_031353 [Paulownia fortunei]|nr:hypothetical protein Pfo_031353 [Paulownia fortunei]